MPIRLFVTCLMDLAWLLRGDSLNQVVFQSKATKYFCITAVDFIETVKQQPQVLVSAPCKYPNNLGQLVTLWPITFQPCQLLTNSYH